jgi:hypothetical protein
MDRKKLRKLQRTAESHRQSQPKPAELVKLAKALGRKKVNRGNEPTYESEEFNDLRPLSIPMHKGKDMAIGTKNSILNQLDDDLMAWEDELTRQERSDNGNQSNDE